MTREWVISARNVTKVYRRGIYGASTLREELVERYGTSRHSGPSAFRALDDVSFELGAGEICAVLGPNGSGKTTLMKLIGSITEPTEGEIRIRGRVASLLEVGAGIDPELSGRENIFLNGAILGFSRRDVQRKLDAIIDYSGVGLQIDTAMKRYSSGNFVRLAFAAAIQLGAEILLIDEVLSVTDAPFRARCIESLRSFAAAGGTVLVAGHQRELIESLCDTSLHLQEGKLVGRGTLRPLGSGALRPDRPARTEIAVRVAAVNAQLNVETLITGAGINLRLAVLLSDGDGVTIGRYEGGPDAVVSLPEAGRFVINLALDCPPLSPGRYTIEVTPLDAATIRPVGEVASAAFEIDDVFSIVAANLPRAYHRGRLT